MKAILNLIISLWSSVVFAQDNSLLFKAERNGIVSYILGTMHGHNISLNSLDPKILEALSKSEIVKPWVFLCRFSRN
jgi:uncharacterized protein YbaP (TraB family)